MQTVNFRCGHCGQLLAVQAQFLGAQVRCPHCQKVVVAPTSMNAPTAPPPAPPSPPAQSPPADTIALDPPPPPAPTPESMPPTMPPSQFPSNLATELEVKKDEHESIFTAPTAEDDLFGHSAQKIEMPTDRTEPLVPLPDPVLSHAAPMPLTIGPSGNDATLTYVPDNPPVAVQTAPPPAPLPWQMPGLNDMPSTQPVNDVLSTQSMRDPTTEAILSKPRSRGGWHIAIFIIPLISYSILATVATGILYYRSKQNVQEHPLKNMTDIHGEHPTKNVPRPDRSSKLPDELLVPLGKTLTLGELEVTPLRLERSAIDIYEDKPEQATRPSGKAIKLYLRLKNVSSDLSYYPLDRYFTRYWTLNPKEAGNKLIDRGDEPYTYLHIGKFKFRGPAGYIDDKKLRPKDRGDWVNEYIVGQKLDTKLKPGETLETFICTGLGGPEVEKELKKHAGETLTWRVQVRRGSTMVEGKRVPCTAVVGVQFTDSDIKNGEDPPKVGG